MIYNQTNHMNALLGFQRSKTAANLINVFQEHVEEDPEYHRTHLRDSTAKKISNE